MKVRPITTSRIRASDDLAEVITDSLSSVPEDSIIVVTSKVVALTEGELYPAQTLEEKRQLARELAEAYLEPEAAEPAFLITRHHGLLGVSAGIDASNAPEGMVIALPANPFASAKKLLIKLKNHYNLNNLGILITDSISRPLRWGVSGTYIGYAGFRGVYDQRGNADLHDRPLKITQVNFAEGCAAAAVACMGEGSESQPICLITQLPDFVEFGEQLVNDLGSQPVPLSQDIYSTLLNSVSWKRRDES